MPGMWFLVGLNVSLASETAATSKSARASGCLLRAVQANHHIPISCSESLSLHSAKNLRSRRMREEKHFVWLRCGLAEWFP